MAGSKSRTPSDKVIENRIAQGYGQGEGEGYKPFFYVRDVPSTGTSTMIDSRVTNRVHHYLSRQEFKVHLFSEYQLNCLDIREQFALLPRSETQKICARLGIRHPVYPGTQTATVFTTDLLVNLSNSSSEKLIAFSVKLTKDLTPRTLQKLLVEKIYWERRNIKWILATEKNIPDVFAKNLEFFEIALHKKNELNMVVSPLVFSQTFEANHNPALSFKSIMERSINEFKISPGAGHALLGAAVWRHESNIDLKSQIIRHRDPIRLLHRSAPCSK